MDIPEPRGSGFVGKHGNDFILANDSWSQILNLRYGPDGGAYFIDWYDKQQCHTMNPNDHDRSNGRVFKVAYRTPATAAVDLRKCSTKELVRLTLHRNDWYVRHARKLLEERQPGAEAWAPLTEIATAASHLASPALLVVGHVVSVGEQLRRAAAAVDVAV